MEQEQRTDIELLRFLDVQIDDKRTYQLALGFDCSDLTPHTAFKQLSDDDHPPVLLWDTTWRGKIDSDTWSILTPSHCFNRVNNLSNGAFDNVVHAKLVWNAINRTWGEDTKTLPRHAYHQHHLHFVGLCAESVRMHKNHPDLPVFWEHPFEYERGEDRVDQLSSELQSLASGISKRPSANRNFIPLKMIWSGRRWHELMVRHIGLVEREEQRVMTYGDW